MKPLLLVALGGALGSVARHWVSGWLLHHTITWRFPAGTFAVNILGCLAVGILAGLIVRHDLFSADTRLFLFTGILGGFTTFSAFGFETFFLFRRGEVLVASANIVLSVVAGLFALWLGFGAIAPRNPMTLTGEHDVRCFRLEPATLRPMGWTRKKDRSPSH